MTIPSKSKTAVRPSFIDVFAGCGGLSLGLMKAGWEGLFAVEHDTNAFETLHHNLIGNGGHKFSWPGWLPQTPHSVLKILDAYGDFFLSLNNKVDMLVGGPPCQGFSSAGRRDSNDPRNKLVETYLQLVDIINPKIVLIENVKGITIDFEEKNSEGVRLGTVNYAEEIIRSLSKNYVVHSRLIDTSQFGVPQKRHRFFIIAVRRDLRAAINNPFDILEESRGAFLRSKEIRDVPISAKSAISDLTIERAGKLESRDSKGFEEIGYLGPITSYQKLMNGGCIGAPSDTRLARHKPAITDRFKKIIGICQASGRLNISLSEEVRASFGLRKRAIRVLDPDCAAPTITSMPDDLIHYCEARTLTVRENARLQSFPDWFAFKGKYTSGGERRRREVPRFTQVANAVPPLIAESIGLALLQYFQPHDAILTAQKSVQKSPVSQATVPGAVSFHHS